MSTWSKGYDPNLHGIYPSPNILYKTTKYEKGEPIKRSLVDRRANNAVPAAAYALAINYMFSGVRLIRSSLNTCCAAITEKAARNCHSGNQRLNKDVSAKADQSLCSMWSKQDPRLL
eukprot:jgi/Botrbrau1/13291/Bobra.27_2s0011.1